MPSNDARNEMLVDVVIDLAAICKKLANNPVVPKTLRSQASEYVQEFEALLPAGERHTCRAFSGRDFANQNGAIPAETDGSSGHA